jgi:DsbC/DsbD-like thiol-disulfide interchange protein
MRILLTLLLVSTMLTLPAIGASPTDLVKAELLADVNSVKPGEPFTAGVLLKMKAHWHVYWKNPGDAGLPTRVEWKLPEGFAAGELKFPIPVTFEQPGPVLGYGYEDEVLLTATITPPKNVALGKSVELSAEVTWLVCDPKTCIPGNASLKLEFPVSDTTKPANTELFAKWRQQFPQRSDQAKVVKETGIRPGPDGPTAFVTWSQPPPKGVQWFAVPPDGSGIENMQTSSKAEVSKLRFSLSPAPKEPAQMQFLVAFTDSNGKRQGVEFGVKLPPVAT